MISANAQRGTTLIEVLIAVLVLAVGLLGVAALQASALRNSQSSYERSQATILTYSLFDAMRADLVAARAGAYNTGGWMCDAPGGATLRDAQMADWMGSLEANLGDSPNTCVNVVCGVATCRVDVRWDDSRGTGATAGVPQTLNSMTTL